MTNNRFREAIEIDFADMDIKTQDELSYLMRIAGYNRKYDKIKNRMFKYYPTQKQLDGAWEYLKSIK